jgi:hypothetical protein
MVVEVIPEGLLTAKRPVRGTCFVVWGMDGVVKSFNEKAIRDLDTMINKKQTKKKMDKKLVAKALI